MHARISGKKLDMILVLKNEGISIEKNASLTRLH